MQKWLVSTFGPTLDNGEVIVFQGNGYAIGVDPAAQTAAGGIFASISAANPPTYSQLSALPCAAGGNWQRIFDAWKADGHVA